MSGRDDNASEEELLQQAKKAAELAVNTVVHDSRYAKYVSEFNKIGNTGYADNVMCKLKGVCPYRRKRQEYELLKNEITWATWINEHNDNKAAGRNSDTDI